MKNYGMIGKNILIVDKYFKMYFRDALKSFDINATEGLALLMLFQGNCKTQDEIISHLHYDKGAMTRTMKSLEEKKFVERLENPKDNRSYIFKITDKAYELKPELINILKEWGDKVFSGIDDIEAVNKAMVIMAKNANDAVKGH